MKKLKSRVLSVSLFCVLFGLPAQLLLPGSLSAQAYEDAGRQPRPPITLEERLEELEKAKIRYEAAIREQEHLRQRIEELEREKTVREEETGERERLERRVEELETTQVAQEEATRTIIRQSLSTAGSKINEFVTLGGTFEFASGWAETFGDPREGTRPGSDQDIRLNTAELDFEILVNDWTLGSIIFAYEDGRDAVFRTTDEFDASVDRVNVDTAFVTIGDTQRFPAFGQFGRMVVPFGISTGAAIGDVLTLSDPLTVEVFETKEDAILIGVEFPTPPVTPPTDLPSPPRVKPLLVQPLVTRVSQDLGFRPFPRRPPARTFMTPPPEPPPFSAAIYSYSGETYAGSGRFGLRRDKTWYRDRHLGATVGYRTKVHCRPFESEELLVDKPRLRWLHVLCPAGIDIDLDYNNSVFDSRFLETEYRSFLNQIGFVSGGAVSAKGSVGPVSFVAEWNGALENARFRDHDLLPIRRKPSAWQLTAAYQLDWNPGVETIGAQGTYIALGYSQSRDLQGITRTTGLVNRARTGWVPERRFAVTVGEWIADGLRLAVEWSKNEDYSRSKGGSGVSADAFVSMLTYEW